jgi:predicted unusual protein kinase regulating ubiquinone biosynthesis (AarF/ABC1/UbiB family)
MVHFCLPWWWVGREARNLEMIRLHMARRYGDRIAVPRALYCNKSVLIMEFLQGEKLQKALQVRPIALHGYRVQGVQGKVS